MKMYEISSRAGYENAAYFSAAFKPVSYTHLDVYKRQANTCTIHLFNHYGTHLDGPMHFYGKGIPLDQVPFGHFFFHKPLLLDIPKEPGAKLMPEDLIPHREDVKDADLLLIRTGFSKYRREKPDVYENNGPAVSSRLARYLQDLSLIHISPLPLPPGQGQIPRQSPGSWT